MECPGRPSEIDARWAARIATRQGRPAERPCLPASSVTGSRDAVAWTPVRRCVPTVRSAATSGPREAQATEDLLGRGGGVVAPRQAAELLDDQLGRPAVGLDVASSRWIEQPLPQQGFRGHRESRRPAWAIPGIRGLRSTTPCRHPAVDGTRVAADTTSGFPAGESHLLDQSDRLLPTSFKARGVLPRSCHRPPALLRYFLPLR